MWILSKILKSLGSNKPAFDNDLSTYWVWNNIWDTHDSIDKLSHDQLLLLYKGWVFASCDAIWDWMALLDIALFKSKKRQDKLRDNPIMDLLTSEMIKWMSVYLKTLWATYLYKETAWNKMVNILLLKTWNVIEIKDWNNNVVQYQYSDWAGMFLFEPDDIIKIESFNPIIADSWMTPLKAVSNQVAMDMASIEFNKLFFENGWRPWTILKHEKKIKQEEKDAYLAKWKANYVWLKNSHKVAFLDQWVDVKDFSSTQKDMDLSAQRTFTMDEVLMAFRVSKPILWKSDWVWFADRKVPWFYFNEFTLKPLAKLIQDWLNRDKEFKRAWYVSFLFPQDKEDLQKEWTAWLITHNQYLIATSRPLIENWNVLFTWETVQFEWVPVDEWKAKKTVDIEEMLVKWLNSAFNIKKFWTEEYNETIWKTKITRTDKYENEVVKIQRKIFNEQEKEILKNLNSKSKAIRKEDDMFDEDTSKLVYTAMYTPFFTRMMKIEWTIALKEISKEAFDIKKLNKWIWDDIDRMANDIDDVTKKEIFAIIKSWNEAWLWADAISLNIRSKFNQYTKKSWRVEKIARTEVTKASNKSQDEAYVQSVVVSQKEWFTALDDRVSPECQVLHWKKVKLSESFLKKGDKDELWNKVTYETVEFPPRHVNCRCTIRPIISRKSFEWVSDTLSQKWITLKINK